MNKNRSASFAAILAWFAVIAPPASATTINFSGSNNYDMGTITPGQNGTITGVTSGNIGSFGVGSSFFPTNTEITFSYTLASGNPVDSVAGIGIAAPFEVCVLCSFPTANVVVGNTSFIPGWGNHSYGSMPGFIAIGNPGLITLVNVSEGLGYSSPIPGSTGAFSFEVWNIPSGDSVVATYSVSAVPLPATLPLFGTGLLVLAGFARMRQKRTL